MITIIVAQCAITAAAVIWRRQVWLRWLTVAVLLGFALIWSLEGGLGHVARFGMSNQDALMKSQVIYGDAYLAGLLAAQRLVYRHVGELAVALTCLAVLAVVPSVPKSAALTNPQPTAHRG